MILEKLHRKRGELRDMGAVAVERAHRAGATAYYRMGGASGQIVREMPDGRRELVQISGGKEIVQGVLKPRKK